MKKQVLIAFVLDSSGSMATIKDATISGFNEFKNSQKNSDADVQFALTVFDSENIDYRGVNNINDVPDLTHDTYIPGALTPLYDAIGVTIKNIDDIGKTDYDKVLFVIMTDGYENASREFTRDAIFASIKEHESEQHWDFVYLGANQDAYAVGISMGIKGGYTKTYVADSDGARSAFHNTTSSTMTYMAASTSPESFFESEEEAPSKTK